MQLKMATLVDMVSTDTLPLTRSRVLADHRSTHAAFVHIFAREKVGVSVGVSELNGAMAESQRCLKVAIRNYLLRTYKASYGIHNIHMRSSMDCHSQLTQ